MQSLINKKESLFAIEDGKVVLKHEISAKIAEFETKAKEIAEQEKQLKQAILTEMEAYGIISVKTDELLISYVPASDRETLDSKALKDECPDVYDTYCKISPVKSSIRIKVR